MNKIFDFLKNDDELVTLLSSLATPKELVTTVEDIETLLDTSFQEKQGSLVRDILDRVAVLIEEFLDDNTE